MFLMDLVVLVPMATSVLDAAFNYPILHRAYARHYRCQINCLRSESGTLECYQARREHRADLKSS